ncbi:MFS transporter, partial [Salmonella enterica subsp. enterica serovar Lubbock]|nr:MFS transporter [Salmonella enterica subsp. enterica serovar Lubbock]
TSLEADLREVTTRLEATQQHAEDKIRQMINSEQRLSEQFENLTFSYSGNWRAMLGVLALPAVLLIILVVFLPNSPRWLAQKGRH